MRRRDFLAERRSIDGIAALPSGAFANTPFTPKPDAWRKFEIITRVEIVKPSGKAQAWVPLPAVAEPDWTAAARQRMDQQRAIGGARARSELRRADAARAMGGRRAGAARAEVVSRIATRDRAVDLSKPGTVQPLSERRAQALYRLDRADADRRHRQDDRRRHRARAFSDVEKARGIYEWIVDNTFRNPKTRGCGIGDIASMLKTGNLGGKCADLNALYVGLARAVGLPARDVYGIRVAPSQFGYKSLGAGSEVVTKAQHCRAEVFLTGFGWVPVDPADVRKVVLEEPPGKLALTDPKVLAAPQDAVRRLGDELARLQRRARRRAARLVRPEGRLPHVPAGGSGRRTARLAGARQLQIRDYREGDRRLAARLARSGTFSGTQEPLFREMRNNKKGNHIHFPVKLDGLPSSLGSESVPAS